MSRSIPPQPLQLAYTSPYFYPRPQPFVPLLSALADQDFTPQLINQYHNFSQPLPSTEIRDISLKNTPEDIIRARYGPFILYLQQKMGDDHYQPTISENHLATPSNEHTLNVEDDFDSVYMDILFKPSINQQKASENPTIASSNNSTAARPRTGLFSKDKSTIPTQPPHTQTISSVPAYSNNNNPLKLYKITQFINIGNFRFKFTPDNSFIVATTASRLVISCNVETYSHLLNYNENNPLSKTQVNSQDRNQIRQWCLCCGPQRSNTHWYNTTQLNTALDVHHGLFTYATSLNELLIATQYHHYLEALLSNVNLVSNTEQLDPPEYINIPPRLNLPPDLIIFNENLKNKSTNDRDALKLNISMANSISVTDHWLNTCLNTSNQPIITQSEVNHLSTFPRSPGPIMISQSTTSTPATEATQSSYIPNHQALIITDKYAQKCSKICDNPLKYRKTINFEDSLSLCHLDYLCLLIQNYSYPHTSLRSPKTTEIRDNQKDGEIYPFNIIDVLWVPAHNSGEYVAAYQTLQKAQQSYLTKTAYYRQKNNKQKSTDNTSFIGDAAMNTFSQTKSSHLPIPPTPHKGFHSILLILLSTGHILVFDPLSMRIIQIQHISTTITTHTFTPQESSEGNLEDVKKSSTDDGNQFISENNEATQATPYHCIRMSCTSSLLYPPSFATTSPAHYVHSFQQPIVLSISSTSCTTNTLSLIQTDIKPMIYVTTSAQLHCFPLDSILMDISQRLDHPSPQGSSLWPVITVNLPQLPSASTASLDYLNRMWDNNPMNKAEKNMSNSDKSTTAKKQYNLQPFQYRHHYSITPIPIFHSSMRNNITYPPIPVKMKRKNDTFVLPDPSASSITNYNIQTNTQLNTLFMNPVVINKNSSSQQHSALSASLNFLNNLSSNNDNDCFFPLQNIPEQMQQIQLSATNFELNHFNRPASHTVHILTSKNNKRESYTVENTIFYPITATSLQEQSISHSHQDDSDNDDDSSPSFLSYLSPTSYLHSYSEKRRKHQALTPVLTNFPLSFLLINTNFFSAHGGLLYQPLAVQAHLNHLQQIMQQSMQFFTLYNLPQSHFLSSLRCIEDPTTSHRDAMKDFIHQYVLKAGGNGERVSFRRQLATAFVSMASSWWWGHGTSTNQQVDHDSTVQPDELHYQLPINRTQYNVSQIGNTGDNHLSYHYNSILPGVVWPEVQRKALCIKQLPTNSFLIVTNVYKTFILQQNQQEQQQSENGNVTHSDQQAGVHVTKNNIEPVLQYMLYAKMASYIPFNMQVQYYRNKKYYDNVLKPKSSNIKQTMTEEKKEIKLKQLLPIVSLFKPLSSPILSPSATKKNTKLTKSPLLSSTLQKIAFMSLVELYDFILSQQDQQTATNTNVTKDGIIQPNTVTNTVNAVTNLEQQQQQLQLPKSSLIAIGDGLNRVILYDINTQIMLGMLKGYRNPMLAWSFLIPTTFSSFHETLSNQHHNNQQPQQQQQHNAITFPISTPILLVLSRGIVDVFKVTQYIAPCTIDVSSTTTITTTRDVATETLLITRHNPDENSTNDENHQNNNKSIINSNTTTIPNHTAPKQHYQHFRKPATSSTPSDTTQMTSNSSILVKIGTIVLSTQGITTANVNNTLTAKVNQFSSPTASGGALHVVPTDFDDNGGWMLIDCYDEIYPIPTMPGYNECYHHVDGFMDDGYSHDNDDHTSGNNEKDLIFDKNDQYIMQQNELVKKIITSTQVLPIEPVILHSDEKTASILPTSFSQRFVLSNATLLNTYGDIFSLTIDIDPTQF